MLGVLFWLELKHLIVDFFQQTPYHYKNKGTYGHPGGLEHAFQHAFATMLILSMGTAISSWGVFWLGVLEFLLHYHIDYFKQNITKDKGWSKLLESKLEVYSDQYFNVIGVDQFLHQLTYILLLCAV